ncbi:MAG: phytanoyl-CoA dioxygenase family protein [Burkholderiales bacterium]|nr:phytanoyl-CoA dioxygenase family protein [Burkholderiales bacterium]
MLDAAQIAHYRREGYLVLPDFKPAAELAALRARALEIVDAFEPGRRPAVFSTRDQARGTGPEFLASAEGIHCFFEEEAFDEHGALTAPKALAINKIGHAMHDLDPVFDQFSHGPRLAALAHDLGLAQALVWQSMFIFKQPGIGGEVKWHQDASFLDTTPTSVTGFWFALEDARRDNGCLWVQPGGHRTPLRERFVRERVAGEDRVSMVALDRLPWPDLSQALPVEVSAGTLVCFHGLLPHWSASNRSPHSRHAYTLHATDARSRYADTNWLQRSTLPLRGFEG